MCSETTTVMIMAKTKTVHNKVKSFFFEVDFFVFRKHVDWNLWPSCLSIDKSIVWWYLYWQGCQRAIISQLISEC